MTGRPEKTTNAANTWTERTTVFVTSLSLPEVIFFGITTHQNSAQTPKQSSRDIETPNPSYGTLWTLSWQLLHWLLRSPGVLARR